MIMVPRRLTRAVIAGGFSEKITGVFYYVNMASGPLFFNNLKPVQNLSCIPPPAYQNARNFFPKYGKNTVYNPSFRHGSARLSVFIRHDSGIIRSQIFKRRRRPLHMITGFYFRTLFRDEKDGYTVFLLSTDTGTVSLCGHIPLYLPWTPLRISEETDASGRLHDRIFRRTAS